MSHTLQAAIDLAKDPAIENGNNAAAGLLLAVLESFEDKQTRMDCGPIEGSRGSVQTQKMTVPKVTSLLKLLFQSIATTLPSPSLSAFVAWRRDQLLVITTAIEIFCVPLLDPHLKAVSQADAIFGELVKCTQSLLRYEDTRRVLLRFWSSCADYVGRAGRAGAKASGRRLSSPSIPGSRSRSKSKSKGKLGNGSKSRRTKGSSSSSPSSEFSSSPPSPFSVPPPSSFDKLVVPSAVTALAEVAKVFVVYVVGCIGRGDV